MWPTETSPWLTDARVCELLDRVVDQCAVEWPQRAGRALLIVPERMRLLGGYAPFARHAERALRRAFRDVRILITQPPGETPLSDDERRAIFPEVDDAVFFTAGERADAMSCGEISAETVISYSNGLSAQAIPLTLPRAVAEGDWDGVLNLEAVVPDDLWGFTGPPQNRWLAAPSQATIDALGALAGATGAENATANLSPPLRQCLLWADSHFWPAIPFVDVALVRGVDFHGHPAIVGFYSGVDQQTYFQAALLSRQKNVVTLDAGVPRIVAMADGERFTSVWDLMRLVPRLRMAIADMGEIVFIAPGLKHVAFDEEYAALVAKLGYSGTAELLERRAADAPELSAQPWIETHLRHGSGEGRCRVYCATDDFDESLLTRLFVRPLELAETLYRYRPRTAKQGWNITAEGEKFYFIPDAQTGIWSVKKRLMNRLNEFARKSFYD